MDSYKSALPVNLRKKSNIIEQNRAEKLDRCFLLLNMIDIIELIWQTSDGNIAEIKERSPEIPNLLRQHSL